MGDPNFQAENHYTSCFYLKQWSSGGKIWAYQLLVQNPKVPHWKQKSPAAVAKLRHLYTRTEKGVATDEVERWFGREFETPAASAIRKAVSDERLTPDDWYVLIRFLAAQDLRTPRSYFEDMARWDKTLQNLLKETLDSSIQKISEVTKAGQALPTAFPRNPSDMPFRVIQDREAGKIGVEVLVGRELWMSQMKRSLNRTAKVLHQHHWTILAPPKGMSWLTSDNPVIHLNFRSASDYKLERAWAKRRMNIMLPLGPQHLLFTQVGERSALRGTRIGEEQASLIRRVTAQNAFRLVFADNPDPDVAQFRRRREDADEYQAERQYWAAWHGKQSEAEESFGGDRGTD